MPRKGTKNSMPNSMPQKIPQVAPAPVGAMRFRLHWLIAAGFGASGIIHSG